MSSRSSKRAEKIASLISTAILWVLMAILPGGITGEVSAQPRSETDYQQMRNDIEIFEAIVNQALGQLFPNPFALVDRAKGFYLNDTGVLVVLGINIKTAITETPFGTVTRSDQADPKKREQKILELKDRLVNILADYGNAINQLRDSDSLVLVAHIVDQNFSQASRNKTIILRILKRDLLAKASRQMEMTDFKKRIRSLEY